MDRRRFLAGAVAAGVGGLAGCGTASGSVRAPSLPEERLDEGDGSERGPTPRRCSRGRSPASM
ncbi:hypothetical protein ACFQFH_12090 [Halobaculum halobium]|uniref:hypothetical protein n=1 Tax=Halobaculum halobium TaxID=3032281 RepID=UPI00361B1D86